MFPLIEYMGWDSEIPEERTCCAWKTESWEKVKDDNGGIVVHVLVFYPDSITITCSCPGGVLSFPGGVSLLGWDGCKHARALRRFLRTGRWW